MTVQILPSQIAREAQAITAKLVLDPDLAGHVDQRFSIPQPYLGSEEIRLIILGQDPTVKKEADRGNINTCLNLDKRGSMVSYLSKVCIRLGLTLKANVYGTNYIKNFFKHPPTKIKEIDVLAIASSYWHPLLQKELAAFPDAIIISLGEPLLSLLVLDPDKRKVRKYWGYRKGWKIDGPSLFSFVEANESNIKRSFFPFPHQPSLRKEFYRGNLDAYIAFVASEISHAAA